MNCFVFFFGKYQTEFILKSSFSVLSIAHREKSLVTMVRKQLRRQFCGFKLPLKALLPNTLSSPPFANISINIIRQMAIPLVAATKAAANSSVYI